MAYFRYATCAKNWAACSDTAWARNEGKYTALANEIRQTQNYIFIQQVRYKFEVYYSIDLDADEAYVLRFLLQPIVENAILHGLARRADPGTLEVHAYLDQADLMICIRDDGVGMDADTLANLRALIAARIRTAVRT